MAATMETATIDPIDPAERAKQVAAIVKDANRSEIHRRTGITLSHVSRVLNRNRTASTRKLRAIALALGVGLEELYECLNPKPKPGSRPGSRPARSRPGSKRGDGKAA